MNILMLGWEFPPAHSGGLGIASTNIARALALLNQNIKIDFVIPSFIYQKIKHDLKEENFHIIELQNLGHLTVLKINTTLVSPYLNIESYDQLNRGLKSYHPFIQEIYGANIFEEIARYAKEVSLFVASKSYHLIHAHDWMTFASAIQAKNICNCTYIAHVHATEIDRTGRNPNPLIFTAEKDGLAHSDHIITVSDYTKKILCEFYKIRQEKISVVHNGLTSVDHKSVALPKKNQIVLFLGRMTLQKGPDYFLEIAKKIAPLNKNIKFIYGGTGDMLPKIISKIIAYGLTERVFCLGHLNEDQKRKAFQMTKLLIMPSVSEPFGLVALEAINADIPVIISKQSGVSEIIKHAFKADFWDIDKMANYVLSVFKYPKLSSTIIPRAKNEIKNLTWHNQAKKIAEVYQKVS